MCHNSAFAGQQYFDSPDIGPLSENEVESLRKQLASSKVRYCELAPGHDRLASGELLDHQEAARLSKNQLATMRLPSI